MLNHIKTRIDTFNKFKNKYKQIDISEKKKIGEGCWGSAYKLKKYDIVYKELNPDTI